MSTESPKPPPDKLDDDVEDAAKIADNPTPDEDAGQKGFGTETGGIEGGQRKEP